MQNKGAILFLAVTLALVSIYQLSFTGATYLVKKDAKEFAQGDLKKESAYLDSIASLTKEEWNYLGFTFRECQTKEINLGLDLKGGMNVILEVSVEDIVKALSNYNPDKTFNDAIALAKSRQKESQADFIDLFGRAFEELDPNAKLASIFGTIELKEKINFNSTNADVLKVLHEETGSAIDNAFNILRSRIDRFGVTQPNISQLESRGRILVELPGVKDPQRVRDLLQGTASLEFWETYENGEIIGFLSQANDLLREINYVAPTTTATPLTEEEEVAQDTTSAESLLDLIGADTTATAEPESLADFTRQNPLFGLLRPNVSADGQAVGGSQIGFASWRDTAAVNTYLKMNQVRALFPRDVRFMWSHAPFKYDETNTLFELHAIKITTRDGRAPLDGDVITSARPGTGVTGSDIKVDMSMNAEGSKIWARMTRENTGKCIAVVLDGYVRSSPRVSGEIKGGSSEISGDFTLEEAEDLSNILKSGKLPAPARIVQDTVVGPTLGKEAIKAGLNSFLIAFSLVLVYMILYYSHRAGLVSDFALLANMFFILGVLASLGAVLTLPGIAGIVLTIGMSVDANVLIYERIREELKAGKGVKLAISDGYKNAYSAIIDANVTTLLVGIVLYTFGTGPIKGFATTLVIGIITSLFSAIFITRLIYEWYLKKNFTLTFDTGITRNFLQNTNFDFIGKRKIFYAISTIVIVIGIGSLVTRGLSQGIDFTGGRTYVVRFEQPVSTAEVTSLLSDSYGETPLVVTFGSDNQVKITTKYKINEAGLDDEVETLLYEGLKPLLGDVDKELFLSEYRVSSETVGPTIADDIKIKAVWAITLSLLIIFLYIVLRFRLWQFGLGAVAALLHDVLFILGVFSLGYGFFPFSMEIDQAFIAAILTIVGYSINDTVVVFDRIREYIGIYRKRSRKEILNMAINSTLTRTINTAVTTFVVLLAIFLWGGEVIRGFTFALLVGIVVGTYSSIYVAAPVVYDTLKRKDIEKDQQKA